MYAWYVWQGCITAEAYTHMYFFPLNHQHECTPPSPPSRPQRAFGSVAPPEQPQDQGPLLYFCVNYVVL